MTGTPLKVRGSNHALTRAERPVKNSDNLDPLLLEILDALTPAPAEDLHDPLEAPAATPKAQPRRAWLRPTVGLALGVAATVGVSLLQNGASAATTAAPPNESDASTSKLDVLRQQARERGKYL